MEGWLFEKRGAAWYDPMWQHRWFQYNGTRLTYADPATLETKGAIDIVDLTAVEAKGENYVNLCHSSGRTYELYSDNPAVCQHFVEFTSSLRGVQFLISAFTAEDGTVASGAPPTMPHRGLHYQASFETGAIIGMDITKNLVRSVTFHGRAWQQRVREGDTLLMVAGANTNGKEADDIKSEISACLEPGFVCIFARPEASPEQEP